MAENPNERSGSRWEPEPADQTTEELAAAAEQPTEILPGLNDEQPPAPKRRIPKAVAAVAIVAAATLGGGAIGLALAGNSSQEVSDTASTSESTAGTGQVPPEGAVPDAHGDGDGRGPGGHFGQHGRGGH